MRLLLATHGSLGDLHPMLALGLGLKHGGHQVTVATSDFYRTTIETAGLCFAPLRPDLSLSDEALVRRIMDGARGSEHLMRGLVFPGVREMHADLLPLALEADVFFASEIVCAAPLVAEQLRKPWVFCSLSPISFYPLRDPPLLPGPPGTHFIQSLGPAGNRFLRRAAKVISHGWWKPVRELRRELGLPIGPSPLFEGKFSPHLNLALFSPCLQPPQPDWPANTVQTGFAFFDEGGAGGRSALPSPVEAFLAAGKPPIVFTLGSAAVALAGGFYAVAASAAQRLGCRALLLVGKNAPPANLPPTILAWDYLPYAQIFPRAAAIVHQGGVGTTAQALRAGRPMLVVPFAHDQFDNAARVVRLGVGRTLSRRDFHAAKVALELRALLETPACAATAAAVGEKIRAEQGVENACEALERRMSK